MTEPLSAEEEASVRAAVTGGGARLATLGGYVPALLATLDAARSLDVDRLARAMHVVDDDVQFMHRDAAKHRDVIAIRVAREYAALPEETL